MTDPTVTKPIEVSKVGAVQASTAVKQGLALIGTVAATLGLAPVVASVTQAQAVMGCINTALGGTATAQLIGTLGALVTAGALGWQQLSSRAKAKKGVALAEHLPNEIATIKGS